ncbi:MAG: preprotein translocase subunit SecE [Albidovulum sp.]|nr:preprotein translocase subunit SecE [Albidovulum sp.]MDE0304889.1 preprotein translocase subunit SecE [Albidovulum sp.]MDE0530156.1 preprotein translocase subunit SecE [Albidovulum sp.]
MAKTNPFRFMQEVRSEVSKIVWPTRRELFVTTVMVFIMAAIASLFFFLIDQVIRFGLSGILGVFG